MSDTPYLWPFSSWETCFTGSTDQMRPVQSAEALASSVPSLLYARRDTMPEWPRSVTGFSSSITTNRETIP